MNNLGDLETWKLARELRIIISKFLKKLPAFEKFLLVSQLLRSSRSISANIAEGFGRFHFQENIQFCRQARGSLFESLDHLYCVKDENYISEEEFEMVRQKLFHLLKVLNGYIAYLKSAKEKGSNAQRKPQPPE
jgi:four helix bundle protein